MTNKYYDYKHSVFVFVEYDDNNIKMIHYMKLEPLYVSELEMIWIIYVDLNVILQQHDHHEI